MRRPNGCGGVRKLSGKRRHPYQAVVSAGKYIVNNEVRIKQVSLGCYATKKEALEALGQWQASHLRADLMYMTVRDIYNEIKDSWTPAMLIHMRAVFKRYEVLADMKLCNIKTFTIESVELPPLSQSTHNAIRMFWHAIFIFGIENDIVVKDYSQYIKFKETKDKVKKEIFTPDEIKILKQEKLFRILLYTGMRINELLSMKKENVYKEDGVLCFHVLDAKTEAGNRIIPVHSAIMKDIKNSGPRIVKMAYMTASRKLDFYIEKYNFGKHTLHDFRRTFASYAKSCGVDEYYRKCLMGHAQGNITDSVYTQAFVKDLKDQIEKIDL